MNHLPSLIIDLALIIGIAGLTTIIFKLLKQPPVLGYIVAGFIASPHIPFTPSVVDSTNVQIWAEIGVIFLLFSLGLDFSFRKLVKLGPAAVIAASTIILGMTSLGYLTGYLLGWKTMNCLFLGGMIAMSSTSIIFKALDDLGLREKNFAQLVLGILVIEDIVAIILMVLLSTIAIKNSFQGMELMQSIGKLILFLVSWFVVGIYLIPSLFKYIKKIISDEMLTIISIGLCLIMVVLATLAGFSAALGAFVMGSIFAETIEAEKIETVTKPIKDLFGAIFFVSVGMMVDPLMIVEHWIPILAITATVVGGQLCLATFGILLAGQPLKTAMQCSFSLTQIGEFAFIIATLGISLKVTDPYLYPIVVAVSVITTFLTPYMMKASIPAYQFIEKRIPKRWKRFMDRYSSGSSIVNHENQWRTLIASLIRITIVYCVIIFAILLLSVNIIIPYVTESIPNMAGKMIAAAICILLMAPFLRAIVAKKNHSREFIWLWRDNRFNWGYLVSLVVFRYLIATGFVFYLLIYIFEIHEVFLIIGSTLIVAFILYSRYLKKQSILIERRFLNNFNVRRNANRPRNTPPLYARQLLKKDLHLYRFKIPANSIWGGRTLAELGLKNRFGVHIVEILRDQHCIIIPGGDEQLFPYDNIQVIGTDDLITQFRSSLQEEVIDIQLCDAEKKEIQLKQIIVDKRSFLLNKTISTAGVRELFQCLIVAIERVNEKHLTSESEVPFIEGDKLWVVGHKDDIYRMIEK